MAERRSIRKLNPPTHISEAYNSSGSLLAKNIQVDDKETLDRLTEMGITYYLEVNESDRSEDDLSSASQEIDIPKPIPNEIQYVRNHYQKTIKRMKAFFESLGNHDIDLDQFKENLQDEVHFFVRQAETKPESLAALIQIGDYDDETFQHSLNVSLLSIIYGHYRDYEKTKIRTLAFAGLLHDIGKTEIPHPVIHKDESLSSEEWETVRKHPQHGYNILKDIGASEIEHRVAREHHERPDGTGYPRGIEEIHRFSKIVSVCDVYEALTAKRVYKESIRPIKAFMKLRDEFMEYPQTRRVVSGLIRALGLYPVGSLVRLSNDEAALVKKIHPEDLRRPSVLVVRDRWDRPLMSPYPLNLSRITKMKKGGPHGEIYDKHITIEKLMPLKDYPELRSQVTSLIESQGRFSF